VPLPDEPEQQAEKTRRGPSREPPDVVVHHHVSQVEQPIADEPSVGDPQPRHRESVVERVAGRWVPVLGPPEPDVQGERGAWPRLHPLEDPIGGVVDQRVLSVFPRQADQQRCLRFRQAGCLQKGPIPVLVVDEQRGPLGPVAGCLSGQIDQDSPLEPGCVGRRARVIAALAPHGLDQGGTRHTVNPRWVAGSVARRHRPLLARRSPGHESDQKPCHAPPPGAQRRRTRSHRSNATPQRGAASAPRWAYTDPPGRPGSRSGGWPTVVREGSPCPGMFSTAPSATGTSSW